MQFCLSRPSSMDLIVVHAQRCFLQSRRTLTCKSGIKDALAKVERARIPVQGYSEEQERLRKWWGRRNERWDKYMHSEEGSAQYTWAVVTNFKDTLKRHVPFKHASLHLLYSSGLTMSFMSLHQKHLSGYDGNPLEGVVEYMISNGTLMQGCTSFLATSLFFILSFRINKASSRWTDARRLYGYLLSAVRNLAQGSQVYVKSKPLAAEIGLMGYAYSRAMQMHLRCAPDQMYTEALGGILSKLQLQQMLAAPHRPFFISEQVSALLTDAFDTGQIKGIRALVALHTINQDMVRIMEGLERIRNTPEPWVYVTHLRWTIVLWSVLLPFSLVPTLQWATPVLSTSIAYVVFKLDDVAVELQNPFGYDRSDLAICLLTDKLQHELCAMLTTQLTRDMPTGTVPQEIVDEEYDTRGLPGGG
eukprot:gnl/MRDRNA2_/MRDRNA2_139233_c0_seq1.p1 gnl/MRDRNA2_/MRDRNA2_139233_c0~~gnl/MRDRNA2_/MRDRNA2_139233_c0_seq1.p1  ORF type:complete len:417 (-),score=43.73 gnl/MRDRNA2_/MRDRNA2_139233_c0_seq1:282-1532(-)